MLTCLRSNAVWMKNWQHLLLKSKVISLTMGYWGIPSRLLFNRVWRIQVGRQCIRSAPLALMDVNHAKGQWLFRRLEVHPMHSVITCSWYVLKKRLYASFFPCVKPHMDLKKKKSVFLHPNPEIQNNCNHIWHYFWELERTEVRLLKNSPWTEL